MLTRQQSNSWVAPGLFDVRDDRPWPWHPLEPQAYDLIMIDCPWEIQMRSDKGLGKSPQKHYDCMPIADIASLPVRDLARESCLLWMWATAPMLDQQIEIMKYAWKFEYVTEGIWVKTTKNGKIGFGHGYRLRGSHEPFILGKVGAPWTPPKNIRSIFMAEARENSRKPDEAYEIARRMVPYGRAADVFSRESRPTWEAFGNETGKFDGQGQQETRAPTGKGRGARTASFDHDGDRKRPDEC